MNNLDVWERQKGHQYEWGSWGWIEIGIWFVDMRGVGRFVNRKGGSHCIKKECIELPRRG